MHGGAKMGEISEFVGSCLTEESGRLRAQC